MDVTELPLLKTPNSLCTIIKISSRQMAMLNEKTMKSPVAMTPVWLTSEMTVMRVHLRFHTDWFLMSVLIELSLDRIEIYFGLLAIIEKARIESLRFSDDVCTAPYSIIMEKDWSSSELLSCIQIVQKLQK